MFSREAPRELCLVRYPNTEEPVFWSEKIKVRDTGHGKDLGFVAGKMTEPHLSMTIF